MNGKKCRFKLNKQSKLMDYFRYDQDEAVTVIPLWLAVRNCWCLSGGKLFINNFEIMSGDYIVNEGNYIIFYTPELFNKHFEVYE